MMALGVACSDEGARPTGPSSADVPGAGAPAADPSVAPSEGAAPAAPSAPAPTAEASASTESRSAAELAAAGRSVYNANCIACHAMDPRQDGALGPAVAGSSLELLEARVMRGEYPEGYAPKRATRVMVPMPHLKDRLPELAAYLGSL